MAISSISRDWGVDPCLVRITTDDDLATITTAGYLTDEAANIEALQNGAFEWLTNDSVLISYDGGNGFFVRDAVNNTFDAEATVPGTLPDTLTSAHIFVGNAGNVATDTAVTGDIGITNTGVVSITAGAIVNADVNAAAAIAYSKLAALTSAHILVGSAGNVATDTAVTGDIGITNAGVTSITAGAIVNADVNAAAAIDFSKLAALTSGNILVGSAGTVPTSVAMSGDATLVASGALSLIPAIPRTISVDVTAAQFNGAYAAPFLILAAPAAGTYYVVHGVQFEFDYGGAQFTNGGVMGIQYDNTANGAGLLTHVGVAAAVVQGVAADFIIGASGFNIENLTGGAAASIVAKGLYLSNKTAAFATGTSDVRVHVTYSRVTTSL